MNAINKIVYGTYGIGYGTSLRAGAIEAGGVASFQKDRASANEASMIALLGLFKGSLNLHCLSHTVTHVGEHMIANAIKPFKEDLCALLNAHGGNNKAASHWFQIFKECWKPPGNTRWWADLELMTLLYQRFQDLSRFCETAELEGDMERSVRMQRIVSTMEDPERRSLLKFELGILSIVCDKLVKATYNLEGDNCCSLVAYDTVVECQEWLNTHTQHLTFPGVSEILSDYVDIIMDGEEEYRGKDRDTLLDDASDHARQILSGGVAYFNSTIMGKLSSDIEIFKMCRFANPIAMRQRVQAPECIMEFKAALESLRRFPTETVNNIVGEWNTYKRILRELPSTESEGVFKFQVQRCMIFWRTHYSALPAMSKFARFCMTLAPSSAAAERVFSYLKNSFTVSQMRQSLEDYTQCSIMLQHNHINAAETHDVLTDDTDVV